MYCSVGVIRQGIDFLCTYSLLNNFQRSSTNGSTQTEGLIPAESLMPTENQFCSRKHISNKESISARKCANNSNNVYAKSSVIAEGQLVAVNFNHRDIIGIVFGTNITTDYTGQVKLITTVLPYKIPDVYIKFIKFVSNYNLIPIGSALKLLCPFSLSFLTKNTQNTKTHKGIIANYVQVKLNFVQQKMIEQIIIDKFSVYLLHGITGSGKTEIFLEVARRIYNGQILILVPEIALSNAMAKKIAERCGCEVFIWHNSITQSAKLGIWRMAVSGEKIVVVGARSALFIPFADLKLIVIDEEHDSTFKQNDHQIYHARDMAIYLASIKNIPIILSSATPSIESYKNAIEGKYKYLHIADRYYPNAKLPNITIDDMRLSKRDAIFSNKTIEKIKYYLANNQQVLIFVNRRGYATKVLCTKCGWKAMCPACDTWLCYHAIGLKLSCHHCGYSCKNITKCKKCGNGYLVNFGIGIEKVYSECKKLFHQYNIVLCSSDTMNTPAKIDKMIQDITNNKTDIIIGTQILAKGHNFNSLNLVVITNLDYMLYTENFRAIENAFQLLSQVIGRAGRTGKFPAEVAIQTYNPDEPLLKTLSDQKDFYETELNNRRIIGMPPYTHITSIEVSSKNKTKAFDVAQKLVDKLQHIDKCTILGPLIPVLHKISYKYRYRIVIVSNKNMQKGIQKIVKSIKLPHKVSIKIDVDPYNFE